MTNEFFRRTLDLLEEFELSDKNMLKNVYFFNKGDGTMTTTISGGGPFLNYQVADGFYVDVVALKIYSDCHVFVKGYRGSLGNHGMVELTYKVGGATTVNEARDPNKVFQMMPQMTELVRAMLRDSDLSPPADLRPLPPASGSMAMRAYEYGDDVFKLNWYSSELARNVAEISGKCGLK